MSRRKDPHIFDLRDPEDMTRLFYGHLWGMFQAIEIREERLLARIEELESEIRQLKADTSIV